MKRPVLVTVSGIVGSGKSTAAQRIAAVVEREGGRADIWRFRTLPCFTLGRPRTSTRAAAQGAPAIRGRGYRPKRLTLRAALGHALRMVAFRVFCRWSATPEWAVSNRYFYDNLAHYELDAPAARAYTAVLRRLMRQPDLAFLLVASPRTIAERRSQYSAEYLESVAHAYRLLGTRFPELIELSSDPDQRALERIEQIVRQRLADAGGHRHRSAIEGWRRA